MTISDIYTNYFKGAVAVDSRNVQRGCLFFALKGERTDGHNFLKDVSESGGQAAVVAKGYQGDSYGLKLIYVEDVLQTLQQMAALALKKSSAKIVAITGSLGKTSTKEFTYQLVKNRFKTVRSPANYNSQIGLPLTILNHTKGDEELLILEMAMTHSGQIAKLVEIAPPDIALLTTVALVHAQNFDSLEDIALAKAEIFSHPHTQKAFINSDVDYFKVILNQIGCETCTYFCDSQILSEYDPALLNLPKHVQGNLIAALSIAKDLEVDEDEILYALKHLKFPERRFQYIEKDGILFINDSYNASASSIKAAISSLPQPKNGGRRIAILGTMPELGKFSYSCHRDVGEFSLKYLDKIYCLGLECEPILDIWQSVDRPAFLTDDRKKLLSEVEKEIKPGDVVLVKGGNTLRLWELIDQIVQV